MSPALLAGILIALGALVSSAIRLRRLGGRDLRSWLPLPVAMLMWLSLFPPQLPVASGRTVLLTPGVTAETALPAGSRLLALPGTEAPARAERVPDLGTALRRHPGLRSLSVLGDGLPERDREALAAAGSAAPAITFEAPALSGIVAVDAPTQGALGHQWSVAARASGSVARVELRDPSGTPVDSAKPDGDGRLVVSAPLRAAGRTRFELVASDAEGSRIDGLTLPIAVLPAPPPIALAVLAGGPDPELKYLRRWAADAGLKTSVRIGLSEGIALSDGSVDLGAGALAYTDVVLIDDRSWASLGEDEKVALLAAVNGGLGLMLRITGDLPNAVATEWRALGLSVSDAASREVSLSRLGAPADARFALAPVAVQASAGATVLQSADDGSAIAWVVDRGAGRIGLSLLTDSFRIRLAGAPARHATLWAELLGAVSRPAEHRRPPAPLTGLRVDRRTALCPPEATGTLADADGEPVALLRDARGCAAWWPASAGWFRLSPDDAASGDRWLYVRAADDAVVLDRAADRAATQRLADAAPVPIDSGEDERAPLPRWPFFLGWLALTSLLWWRERPTG